MWWLDQLSKGSIFKFKSLSGCCKAMVSTFFLLFTLYKHTSERSMSPSTFEYPLKKCSCMTVKSVSPARDTQSSNASQCSSETAASSVNRLCFWAAVQMAVHLHSMTHHHCHTIIIASGHSASPHADAVKKNLNMMRLFSTFPNCYLFHSHVCCLIHKTDSFKTLDDKKATYATLMQR